MIRLFTSIFALFFFSSCMLQYAAGLTQIQQEKYKEATYNFSVALTKDPKTLKFISPEPFPEDRWKNIQEPFLI
jgi:hypothetical protein